MIVVYSSYFIITYIETNYMKEEKRKEKQTKDK